MSNIYRIVVNHMPDHLAHLADLASGRPPREVPEPKPESKPISKWAAERYDRE